MSNESIVGYRLSPQQRHLWSLQQLHSSRPFRAHCTILIEGNLDPKVLSDACNYLVNRHEILRTTFHQLDDMSFPVQVIGESAVPIFTEADLSAIDEVLAAEQSRTDDLSEGPLVRFWLFKTGTSSHLLLMTLPSLCGDASGLKNLVRDLSRCYAACLHGEELTDEPLPYIVIAEWQNELLEKQDSEAGKTFWSKRYKPDLIRLKLPFAEPSHEFTPRISTIEIDRETSAQIASISSSHDCSVSTFLMACWQVLLSRFTGQPDIVVGAASDGRTDDELEHALGLMTKYLPLVFHVDAQSRFSEVMKQVEEVTREAREWQEAFSWNQLAAMSLAEETSFVPFCFEFEERPASYSDGGLDFTVDQLLTHTDNFTLKLRGARTKDDALRLAIDYDSDVYRYADVERLAQQLRRLIASAVANPEGEISRLEIINDDERCQMYSAFNDTESEFASEKCIHQLFEEQVEKTPEATALVYEEQQLSYAELNRRANRLAHYLRRRGVGPEQVVGLLLERSTEMVVAIMAVLKAGGAYLPLDPAYPEERLRYMLDDSGAELLLTQRELVSQFGEMSAAVLCIEASEWVEESGENPATTVAAENLAYVIYTSGSTGKPKAVLMTHQPPINLLAALSSKVYESQPLAGRRASLNASFSFDASVQQLLLLLTGATIYLIPQRLRADGPGLLSYLREQEVENFDCTPSQLRMLLSSGLLDGSGQAPHRLLIAGEAIDDAMWQQLQNQQEGKRIYNIYGPTEACVDATAYLVAADGSKRPLIGKPLANYEIYVLDEWRRAVPPWVRGEIYIGGAGLARCYHGRPELTAERFGPHPYSREEGARLYRTGDLGRYLPDGNIEYLGRADSQVKVRGYRIELGEVEAVLRGCEGVREAVVQLRGTENGEGEERLVGYVVPEATGELKVEQLRGEMGERVPEYMIPAVFVMLERLPLNSSGKIDWRELPEPEGQRPDLGVGYVAARNEDETALVKIWQEVLGLEQVGVEDNFFDLGGHSLLATQVISRVREALDAELPLRVFFETPTIASLAAMIVQGRAENDDDKMLEEILREIEELPVDGNIPVLVETAAAVASEGEF